MKKTLTYLAAIAISAALASCGGSADNNSSASGNACDTAKCEQKAGCAQDNAAQAEPSQAATAAADLSKKYICPARCESSDTPGTCSQCGMELVEQ